MLRKTLFTSLFCLGLCAWNNSASAQHDMRAYISESGVQFISQVAPSYIPSQLTPGTITQEAGCIEFQQRNTTINLSIDEFEISMPENGRLRVEMEFSGDAAGDLYADNIYACFGEVTCQDDLTIQRGRAILDYDIFVVNGEAVAEAKNIDFSLEPEDVSVVLSDCEATGESLTDLLEFGKEWILAYLEAEVVALADENIGPMLEDILTGFSMQGSLSVASYSAEIQDAFIENGGLEMRAGVDIADRFAPDACVAEFDRSEPLDIPGAAPRLQGDRANHANLALNLGLLNKGLYTIWRRGYLCLTDAHIQALGLDFDLSLIGVMLPGFPAGTEFSLGLKFGDYPRLRPSISDDGTLTFELDEVLLQVHGDRPDGSRNTLDAKIDIEATATLAIDSASNAIVAHLDGARIVSMVLEDERKATGDGFDVARIQQMVHEYILPHLVHELGQLPVTGPVFSFAGYAAILRKLSTTNAYAAIGLDLFRIPENDNSAPETQIISVPEGVRNPSDSFVVVDGQDGEIPSELLKYQFVVDGEVSEPTGIRKFPVGEAGVTKSYEIRVAAVDLSGNIDPSPEVVNVMVDGIPPLVNVQGSRSRPGDKGPVDIAWNVSDDLTAAESLNIRVEVFRLEDSSDTLSGVLLETQELGLGARNTTVEVPNESGVYRVEIHATDEAGNDAKSSVLLTIGGDGGCSVGGRGGAGNLSLLLLAMGLVAARRRRLN